MTNVANNFIPGDAHPTDTVGSRIVKKSTNNFGVHTEHVISDGPTLVSSSKVAFTAASAQSGALNGTMVRLVPTQNCHVTFGANPTAVADGSCMYLLAGSATIVGITSGQKLAAIQDLAGGNLFISLMA